MDRRRFLALTTAGVTASTWDAPLKALQTPAAADSTRKPNIVFVVSDQHRVGLTKAAGYPLDTSPALDRLAARGVSFDRAYCASPLCVPSRTCMLTGRWPEATHVRSNSMIEDASYPTHLYKVAREQGYRTAMVGKNHTFLKEKDTDFWRAYELANGYIASGAPPEFARFEAYLQSLHANIGVKPTPFPVEVQHPYRIVSDSIEFMQQAKDGPFLLQVGFSEPHDPEQVPAPYYDMFPPDKLPSRCAGPEALKQLGYRAQWLYQHQQAGSDTEQNWKRYVSNYLGMLRLIDDQLARLMAYLEHSGLMKNTIVIYLADHGDYLMDYGLGRKGVGLPECLTRIPFIWAGAGIKHSPVGATTHVSNVDFFPTVCEAMGVGIPHGVQGRSLWPLLQGQPYPTQEFRSIYATVGLGGLYYEEADHIPVDLGQAERPSQHAEAPGTKTGYDELNKVTMSGLQKMVRMGDWKLIFDMMGYGQLYHLPSDPCELHNRFGETRLASTQAALMAELLAWTIRAQDPLPTGAMGVKYQTKWPVAHNWYAGYRRGTIPNSFIP